MVESSICAIRAAANRTQTTRHTPARRRDCTPTAPQPSPSTRPCFRLAFAVLALGQLFQGAYCRPCRLHCDDGHACGPGRRASLCAGRWECVGRRAVLARCGLCCMVGRSHGAEHVPLSRRVQETGDTVYLEERTAVLWQCHPPLERLPRRDQLVYRPWPRRDRVRSELPPMT